jgi:hypothetical protein
MTFSIKHQSQRFFATSEIFKAIPGLRYYPKFLENPQQNLIQQKSSELFGKIINNVKNSPTLSLKHNLKSKEYYLSSQIMEDDSKIQCQYFEKYGEEGHTLTYFMGNNNIPKFIKNEIIPKVLEIPEVKTLRVKSMLSWNFTFNTYSLTTSQTKKMSGFPFHKDIDSNGIITMIYSIGATTEFQIRHPKDPNSVHRIPLTTNSLVLLSGESRWDYEHCVVPSNIEVDNFNFATEVESIKRISLVLGCT